MPGADGVGIMLAGGRMFVGPRIVHAMMAVASTSAQWWTVESRPASVSDFGSVLDMEAICGVNIGVGVGPLGLRTDHLRRVLEKAPRIVGNTWGTSAWCHGIQLNRH